MSALNVFAVVVGLERYDAQGFDQPGPAMGALRIAEWLLNDLGVPPDQLWLIATTRPGSPHAVSTEARIDALAPRGINIGRSGRREHIESVLDQIRMAGHRAGGQLRLLLYWSGHGYAGLDGQRLWVCEDLRFGQIRCLDAHHLCRQLKSWSVFREQLVLVDTCAVDSELSGEGGPRINVDYSIRQTALFATPEGRFTFAEGEVGKFTDLLLDELPRLGWPDEAQIESTIVPALEARGQSPFRVYTYLSGKASDRIISASNRPAQDKAAKRCLRALARLPLGVIRCRPHYRLALACFGQEPTATSVAGMVHHLAAVGDPPRRMSRALLQFLLRLANQPEINCSLAVRALLDSEVAKGHVLLGESDDEERLLAAETGTRVLAVELVPRRDAGRLRIGEFRWKVQLQDGSQLPSSAVVRETVSGWDEFGDKLATTIDDLVDHEVLRTNAFEIHILADLPFFHLPFHRIPGKTSGLPLGIEHVVLVRYKLRMPHPEWEQRAETLHQHSYDIALHPIPPEAAEPNEAGVYFAAFPVTDMLEPRLSGQLLLHIRDKHIPFILWLHELPTNHSWIEFRTTVIGWLRRRRLREFPRELLQLRTGEERVAEHLTLFWDDPAFSVGERIRSLRTP